MKTKKLLALAVIATGFLSPLSAMAGAVLTGEQVQTFNFSNLNQSTLFSFAGFNSTLGTLNSVHFEWLMDKTLSTTVLNFNLTPLHLTNVTATSTTTFTGSGIASLLTDSNALTTMPFTGNVAAATSITIPGFGTFTNPTSMVIGSATANNLQGGVCLSNDGSCGAGNTNLNSYIGGANLFNIAISNLETHTVPSGVFSTNTGATNGNIKLFYDYTKPANVPEPVTISLMGLGLAYLTVSRKKRASYLMA